MNATHDEKAGRWQFLMPLPKAARYASNLSAILALSTISFDGAISGLLIYAAIILAGIGTLGSSTHVNAGLTVTAMVLLAAVLAHWTADGPQLPTWRSVRDLAIILMLPLLIALAFFVAGALYRRTRRHTIQIQDG